MPGFLKGKKLIIGAVALILAAIAAVVAVSFTYAAYRKSLLSEGGATVAGMVADYVRGNAYRFPGEQIEYDDSSSDGSIVISDLSPGDILDYSFFVNGYRENADGTTSFNEVLLRVTCEFSFTYAYPTESEDGKTQIMQVPLSALPYVDEEGTQRGADLQFYPVANENGEINAEIMPAIEAKEGDLPVYYDPSNNTDWQVSQYQDNGELTQKFGFYIPPVSSADAEGASQGMTFRVLLPENNIGDTSGGAEDYSDQFRLTVSLDIVVEQVLSTQPGQSQ